MEDVIRNVAEELELTRNNLREFLNTSFEKITKKYNLCENYQRRGSKFGTAFEYCFKIIMEEFFPSIPIVEQLNYQKLVWREMEQ